MSRSGAASKREPEHEAHASRAGVLPEPAQREGQAGAEACAGGGAVTEQGQAVDRVQGDGQRTRCDQKTGEREEDGDTTGDCVGVAPPPSRSQ